MTSGLRKASKVRSVEGPAELHAGQMGFQVIGFINNGPSVRKRASTVMA